MLKNEEKKSDFAKILRGLIDRKQITQSKLATVLQVTRQTVSLYCSGKRFPESEQLIKIAEYFEVSIDYLLTGKRMENKSFRDAFKLSEQAIENLQAVAAGYFGNLTPYLDKLLSNKNFYVQLWTAVMLTKTDSNGEKNIRRALLHTSLDADTSAMLDRALEDVTKELSRLNKYDAANTITRFFIGFFGVPDIRYNDWANNPNRQPNELCFKQTQIEKTPS